MKAGKLFFNLWIIYGAIRETTSSSLACTSSGVACNDIKIFIGEEFHNIIWTNIYPKRFVLRQILVYGIKTNG